MKVSCRDVFLVFLFFAAVLVCCRSGNEQNNRDGRLSDSLNKSSVQKKIEAEVSSLSDGQVDPLRFFAPPEIKYVVSPGKKHSITGSRGTVLEIPEYAFVDKDGRKVEKEVVVSVSEALDSLDIAGSGISMEYTENGQTAYFQSAGMFKVTAEYDGQELSLAEGKTIRVAFPDVEPGDEYFVYYLDEKGNWRKHGHNQEVNNQRLYRIDTLTWWNFDKPLQLFTCVSADLLDPDNVMGEFVQVFSVATGMRGAFSGMLIDGKITVNILSDIRVKICVIDQLGNMGFSDEILTSKKQGDRRKPEGPGNYYQHIDPITIRKIDTTLLEVPSLLKEKLGIEEDLTIVSDKRFIYSGTIGAMLAGFVHPYSVKYHYGLFSLEGEELIDFPGLEVPGILEVHDYNEAAVGFSADGSVMELKENTAVKIDSFRSNEGVLNAYVELFSGTIRYIHADIVDNRVMNILTPGGSSVSINKRNSHIVLENNTLYVLYGSARVIAGEKELTIDEGNRFKLPSGPLQKIAPGTINRLVESELFNLFSAGEEDLDEAIE